MCERTTPRWRQAALTAPPTGRPRPGQADFEAAFLACLTPESAGPVPAGCIVFDFDSDKDVDCFDWFGLRDAWTDPGKPAFPLECAPIVPATSSWSLLILVLLVIATATLLDYSRRRTPTMACTSR